MVVGISSLLLADDFKQSGHRFHPDANQVSLLPSDAFRRQIVVACTLCCLAMARATMPASSVPTARPRSTTESWHRRDREHKINLGFLYLAELTTKQQKKLLHIALFTISLKSGECQLLEISEV